MYICIHPYISVEGTGGGPPIPRRVTDGKIILSRRAECFRRVSLKFIIIFLSILLSFRLKFSVHRAAADRDEKFPVAKTEEMTCILLIIYILLCFFQGFRPP